MAAAQKEPQYVHALDKMDQQVVHGEVSTSKGAAVSGARIHVGLVHKARGTGSRPHSHPNEQFNFVLQGTLQAEIDGKTHLVPKGSVIHIPANKIHSIIATPEEDVIFYVCKDTSHTLGNAISADGKYTGPRYEPGFEPKK
ncbi:MAG: cupin domain-containing protein [Betaproteobacteria bacterium]|nr:cupin domain-containing protein [Betaproteobacteria bacterium]